MFAPFPLSSPSLFCSFFLFCLSLRLPERPYRHSGLLLVNPQNQEIAVSYKESSKVVESLPDTHTQSVWAGRARLLNHWAKSTLKTCPASADPCHPCASGFLRKVSSSPRHLFQLTVLLFLAKVCCRTHRERPETKGSLK